MRPIVKAKSWAPPGVVFCLISAAGAPYEDDARVVFAGPGPSVRRRWYMMGRPNSALPEGQGHQQFA